MAQFHWKPEAYLELMHREVPDYERLQDETAAATGTDAKDVLELGTGTGETARRVLARNPAATLLGLDAGRDMLDGARAVLGDVVVPQDPADVVTPIDADYDRPSTVPEQLRWLAVAGLRGRLVWAHRDLAVLVGEACPT